MGISRSGSTVVAYAMKKQHWSLEVALPYVKDRRSVVNPNNGFVKQLQTYNGILNARSDPEPLSGGQRPVFAPLSHDSLQIELICRFLLDLTVSSVTAPSGGGSQEIRSPCARTMAWWTNSRWMRLITADQGKKTKRRKRKRRRARRNWRSQTRQR